MFPGTLCPGYNNLPYNIKQKQLAYTLRMEIFIRADPPWNLLNPIPEYLKGFEHRRPLYPQFCFFQ